MPFLPSTRGSAEPFETSIDLIQPFLLCFEALRRGPGPIRAGQQVAWATVWCAVLAYPVTSWGQPQSNAADEAVQRVVVTATRSSIPVRQLAADVTVISSDTLSAARGESLVEIISRVGGVQISRTGGPGQTTGSFIRGAAQKQSIVLVDGLRMVDATSGQVSLETLSPDHIERIEILKGPASSIWGADAVGGVIHIITRQPKRPLESRARVAVGGYASREIAASLGGQDPGGQLDWYIGAAGEKSQGVSVQTRDGSDFNPDRDGYRLGSAHVSLGMRLNEAHRVAVRAFGSSLNSQYDGTEGTDSSKDLRTLKLNDQVSLTWTGQWASDISSEVRVGRSTLRSRSGITQPDDIRSARNQISVQTNWNVSRELTTSAFVEGTSEEGRLDGFYGDYTEQRRNQAVGVAVQGGRTGDFSWQLDARREVSNVYGGTTTARAGARWNLSDEVSVLGVWGSTFRAPTFDDLYYPGFSNPNLQSERGRSQELGVNWAATSSLDVSTRVWRNRVTDLIESDQSTFIPYNVSEALLEGVGLQLRGSTLGMKWGMQSDWMRAVNAVSGQRLARRAPQQHVLSASLPIQRWTYSADLKFLGQRPDLGRVLDSETTLNLGASWRPSKDWVLRARLLNATDERVQPAYGYQGLGRQFWLGLEYAPATR